jgi:RimJ/RimL family protein N-acetyltransferase
METSGTSGMSGMSGTCGTLAAIGPVTLEGDVVRLEPLSLAHAPGLHAAAQDASIWRWMPTKLNGPRERVERWIDAALLAQEAGTILPFATVLRASGEPVGATRYLNISRGDRGLEIGWTWLAPRVQRTAVNSECKYLLLRHAFETLGAIRVQLKTDGRNTISQRAIERLGAIREGTLRKHMILEDGYQRDSVMYSILDDEWPAVRARLEGALAESERP